MHATAPQILAVAFTFVLAGMVKGIAGMGLPTVAMGLLGLLMAPGEAAAFVVVPSLLTNIWQYFAGSRRLALLRRTWPMLVTICLATWASAGLISGAGAERTTLWLGAGLVAYAAAGLASVRFSVSPRQERWLSPVMGAATGLVTGACGVFVVPAAAYLQALDLPKDDLVQALGLSFTSSTIALAAGLATHGALEIRSAGASVLCTAPALLGMAAGQIVRAKVHPTLSRRLFFVALLFLGGDLMARSFV